MTLQILPLDGRLHDRAGFACGVPALDTYLREQAGQRQRGGIATTHILTDASEPTRILGYCSLAAAQLHLHHLQPPDRKHLPAYPVLAVRIGRLAVAVGVLGHSYGRMLVGHAANCAVNLRKTPGVHALVVDALHAKAAGFYRAYGFRETAESSGTLYLPLGNP